MTTERRHNQQQKGRRDMTAQPPATDSNLLTLDELARKLRLHPATTRGLWRRRVIPGLKLGHRTLRFSYPEVLDAIRQATK